MSWTVVWTRPAVDDLRRLDRSAAERVRRAVRRLAEEHSGDVTRLQGVVPPEWRLRVGDWRVRFGYDFEAQTIQILRVRHRREAYRG
ncbi:MAG: type II toxin-antitoxin system RelE family toxin [Chloroflexota bacterium]